MLHWRDYRVRHFAGWLLVVGSLLSLGPIAGATTPGPSDVVRRFYGELLNTMQHAGTLGARGRYQQLEPIVRASFDVPFMARLSIGPSWSKLSVEQKQRATQAYGRYIAAVYATRFDEYTGQRFEILGEQQIKHGTLVKTQIIKANGEPVKVDYMMRRNGESWLISDIYLDGAISEVATRRAEFATILKNDGVDGLIAALNRKADMLTGTAARSF